MSWYSHEVYLLLACVLRPYSRCVCILQLARPATFCSCHVQWLCGLRTGSLSPSSLDHLDSSFTLPGMAACLLERVSAQRLEGCNALHCAALSGDASMVGVLAQPACVVAMIVTASHSYHSLSYLVFLLINAPASMLVSSLEIVSHFVAVLRVCLSRTTAGGGHCQRVGRNRAPPHPAAAGRRVRV